MDKVSLAAELALIEGYWQPRVIGELNGQLVRLAKFQGEYHWHRHRGKDELFWCLAGCFEIQLRERTITLGAGEFFIVPAGTDHCPRADQEAHVLLFEPAGTVSTGDGLVR